MPHIKRGDMTIPYKRIILALDGMNPKQAFEIAKATRNLVAGGKINDAIDQAGAGAINDLGFDLIMADPKLHDIPATVRNRMLAYKGKANFVTVHASNQYKSLQAAAVAARQIGVKAIAVTVLTSMSSAECKKIYGRTARKQVLYLATRARRAGLHGIVCSPQEVTAVRKLWPKAIIICPGVRSKGADAHDQKRVDTPENAIRNGADFVVVGREVTGEKSSVAQGQAAMHIQENINQFI